MALRKKKKKKSPSSFEINVTPMVDMFSVIISFLLVTAVFSATGQARVDVPFLSSRPPDSDPEDDKKDPPKSLTLNVEAKTLTLEISTGKPGERPESIEYQFIAAGLDALQERVYQLRKEDLRVDTVTMMTDEDIRYEDLVQVIDTLRVLKSHREPLVLPEDYKLPRGVEREALVPKLVLGSIIL